MLLYGPPGTGKTLIARQIGKMLNGKEPKIVNGPEVLNKFVGAFDAFPFDDAIPGSAGPVCSSSWVQEHCVPSELS